MDAILRYFEMLRFIPKEPESISTPDLLKKLQDLGYEVDIRTVQRDLNKLSSSGLFPFTSSDETKPLCWFWPKQSARMQFPLMSADEALTFKLAEQFLIPLLPLSVIAHLADYFELADGTLKHSPLAHWPDKVRTIPANQTLLPPQIDVEVLKVVYEALLKNRRFSAGYQRRDEVAKHYEVNPLGLMFRGNVAYLLATLWDYQDVKQLALHRFEQAILLDKAVTVPVDYDPDVYIASGEFEYPTAPDAEIQLTLKVCPWVRKYLSETPLSADQRITALEDGYFRLQASVKDTLQLRWWLRGFGADIEVLEPDSLRQTFAETVRLLGKIYGM